MSSPTSSSAPPTSDATPDVQTSTPADDSQTMESVPTTRAPKRTVAEQNLDIFEGMQKKKAAKRQKAEDGYVFYYRCPTCNRPAIFFAENPIGKLIRDEDWHADYGELGKTVKEAWPHDAILCQSCLKEGRETTLGINRPSMVGAKLEDRRGHPFRIFGRIQRYILKVSKDAKVREREGSVRADAKEVTA